MRVIEGRGWLIAIARKNTSGFQASIDRTKEINEWCEENFGKNGDRWYSEPRQIIQYAWRFRHEEDRTLFIMVWG
jgi:hypothetical protein